MKKLLCIIPFYNEESRFSSQVYEKIFQEFSNIDFLLVDDKSTDATLLKLTKLADKESNIELLSLKKNVGKAAAIRSGILKCEIEKYDFVGYLDADLATPMSEFVRLFDYISAHPTKTFVMGCRIKLIGNQVKRSLKRHYFGRIFATIISQFVLKTPIYDTQCGIKIIESKTAKFLFDKPFITRWLFDVQLLLRLKNMGVVLENNVIEIPLNEWTEMENSKIKFSEIIRFPFQILKIYYHYVW